MPKWQALRWNAFGDGLLDALILWRNEPEREVPLAALIEAFEVKVQAALRQLDDETPALAQAPLAIGHITLVCALGYLDNRFETLVWRSQEPGLADWFEHPGQRPSFAGTAPEEG